MAIATGSDWSKRLSDTLVRGELAPDEIIIDVIRRHLQAPTAAAGWVLDGYPRTAFQAEELDFLLDRQDQKIDYALWLNLPIATLVSRSLQRAAIDDTPSAIQRRIETSLEQTLPMLDYYDYRQRLLRIDGTLPPDCVTQTILAKIQVAQDPPATPSPTSQPLAQ
jgi:adenylate kinase